MGPCAPSNSRSDLFALPRQDISPFQLATFDVCTTCPDVAGIAEASRIERAHVSIVNTAGTLDVQPHVRVTVVDEDHIANESRLASTWRKVLWAQALKDSHNFPGRILGGNTRKGGAPTWLNWAKPISEVQG